MSGVSGYHHIAARVVKVGDRVHYDSVKHLIPESGRKNPAMAAQQLGLLGCMVQGNFLTRVSPPLVSATIESSGATMFTCADDHIGRVLVSGRWYEQRLLDYTRTEGLVTKDSVVIDLGAHIGNHSVYWAFVCRAAKVIAVEAHSPNFLVLGRNLSMNGCNNAWCNHALVVPSDQVGADVQYQVVETPGNTGMTRFEPGGDRSIPTVSLPSLMVNESRVDLVKIDIEGAAPEIIEDPELEVWIEEAAGPNRPHFLIEAASQNELDRIDAVLVEQHGYHRNPRNLAATPTYHWSPVSPNNEDPT